MIEKFGTIIELTDQISAPIRNITNTVNLLTNAFQTVQTSSAGNTNTYEIEEARASANEARTALIELSNSLGSVNFSKPQQDYSQLNRVVDETDNYIKQNTNAQNRFNNSVNKGSSGFNGLNGKISAALAAYIGFRGIEKVMDVSDTMTQTTARLNLMNDGLQSTQDLQNKIYLSAQRARASYSDTADFVSKLGQRTKNVFSSNDEAIQFAENLNLSLIHILMLLPKN